MLLNKEVEDLGDDCFEGSSNEHRIFTKVFFGGDAASKRCDVTGVANFECEPNKNTDILLCYNSERSAVMSQSSSEYVRTETCNVNEASKRTSSAGCSPKRPALVEKNEHKASLKRLKFSVVGFSNAKSDTINVLNCSSLSKEIESADSVRPTDRDDDADLDALKCTLPSDDGKDAAVTITIASPVSQESFTNRGLAATPSFTVGEKPGCPCPVNAEERSKEFDHPRLDESEVSVKQDSMKDPRSLLHQHALNLLIAAGWCVETRKRPSRSYSESVYRSPQRRPVREFPKAWRICGQLLFENGHALMQDDGSKEWADFSQFSSDLSYTLTNIEKTDQLELPAALVQRWCLLDPFVVVVYIDKKIGALRKGELVKVTRSITSDMINNLGAVSALKNKDSTGDQVAERQLALLSGSSLAAAETAIPVSEAEACEEPSGDQGFSILSAENKGAGRLLTGVSIDTANKDSTCFSSAHGLVSSSIQSASCLYDLPVTGANHGSVRGVPISVSFCQDGDTNFSSFEKHGAIVEASKHAAEDVSTDSLRGKDESLEGQAADRAENHLKDRADGCFHTQGSVKTNVQHDSRVCSAFKSCRPSLSKYSVITNLDDDSKGHLNLSSPRDEPISPEFLSSEVVQRSGHSEEEDGQCTVAHSAADVILKRKIKRKSKRISEIKLTTLYQNDNLGATSPNKAGMPDNNAQIESKEVEDDFVTCVRNKECKTKSSSQRSSKHSVEKKESGVKKIHYNRGGSRRGRKRCQFEDDDLLVSAIIKNKDFSSNHTRSSSKPKAYKSRVLRKLKSQKGSCRLLLRGLKGGTNFKGSSIEIRTVLSWLIDTGVIALNDVIVYRNPKDESVVKDGLVSRDGIICKCCNMSLSVSEFKIHAGFKLNRPCLNLFMESGKPFTLCLLQAWSEEYKTRKSGPQIVRADDDDQNDDSCGLCGDVGELICCDNCPSTFHQACLSAEELPEGSWYCLNCTCRICGDLVNDKEVSSSSDALICSQCEHKYHKSCQKGNNVHGAVSDSWFCGANCQEVYTGLRSQVGIANCIADGFSWTLLRCIHDDQKVLSAQRFALKAECNSKLAIALTIMEECFVSMVDPRTGIDMIPQVLYNWGSEFARLNFHGFYSAVLEKDDVVISVASIRVHGTTVAEMPLIATCSKYRRQGMCRRLITVIEEMLTSLKVEKIVLSAIPSLVDTWTEGFGFVPVEPAEKESLQKINLMVFPGTILLKKLLHSNQNTEKKPSPEDALPAQAADESAKVNTTPREEPLSESVQISDQNISANEMVPYVESPNACDETEPSSDEQKLM